MQAGPGKILIQVGETHDIFCCYLMLLQPQHTGASPWEAADIAIEEYEGEGEDGKGTHINAYIEIKKLLEAAQSGGLQ